MLREYIRNAIPKVEDRIDTGTIRGAIKLRIADAIVAWQAASSVMPDGTLRGLINFEVSLYMTSLSEDERRKRKDALLRSSRDPMYTGGTTSAMATNKTKGKRTSGFVTVTCIAPAQGQIEDGTIISFSVLCELFIGDRWPYSYNVTTGIYTVYAGSKGKINPLFGDIRASLNLGEQTGKLHFTQDPAPGPLDSTIYTLASNADITLEDAELCYRFDEETVGYIKNKVYKEVKSETSGEPAVTTIKVVKTLDLSSYLPTVGRERVTIGKMLYLNNVLCILVTTDLGVVTYFGADDEPDEGRQFNWRQGGATIKGELLLINRDNWLVNKITSNAVTAAHQTRYSGFIDIIADASGSEELITAHLSEVGHMVNLNYDTAKIFVEAADRGRPLDGDFTAYTRDAWYTQLTHEVNNHGYPKKYHVIKTGAKTWSLNFPKLTITKYTVNSGLAVSGSGDTAPSITKKKLLYEDVGETISSKHGYDCYGGYINCMLYQDPFDEAYPIYVCRGYDAWLQLPYISDDYTLVAGPGPNTNFRVDTGVYRNAPLPGEILGFFGNVFSKLVMPTDQLNTDPGTLTFCHDIPGDHGKVRSFMRDDEAGNYKSISTASASTHITLMALNSFVSTPELVALEKNSIFNIFSGGPGNHDWAYDIVQHSNKGFVHLYCVGLHLHGNRFVVIHDKDDVNIIQFVFGGSYEKQVTVYPSGEQARIHSHDNFVVGEAGTGVYRTKKLDPTTKEFLSVGSAWWEMKGLYNHVVEPKWQGSMQYHIEQYTINVSRSRICVIDTSTYYLCLSLYVHQYDLFNTGYTAWWGGLLWWAQMRELYVLNKDNVSGWTAADSWNDTRGQESVGAELVTLQYYN